MSWAVPRAGLLTNPTEHRLNGASVSSLNWGLCHETATVSRRGTGLNIPQYAGHLLPGHDGTDAGNDPLLRVEPHDPHAVEALQAQLGEEALVRCGEARLSPAPTCSGASG